MKTIVIKHTPRTNTERIRDNYCLLRVAISRMLRGDKPRFKILFH